jgi:tetratricopeptide (TPR) repeat protein
LNVGKAREAIPYFDRAIRLNPRYTEAYTNRGIAWREKADLSEASRPRQGDQAQS